MEQRLRVLHVHAGASSSQRAEQVRLLVRLLGERGVTCVGPGGVAVRPEAAAGGALAPAALLRLLRSPADLIHLHLPDWRIEMAAALAVGRRPLVVTLHDTRAAPGPLRRVRGRLLRRAARILVESTAALRAPVCLPHRRRIRVIGAGVDLDLYRPATDGDDPLPHLPHPRVLVPGPLSPEGVESVAFLLRDLPDIHLVVHEAGVASRRRLEERAAGGDRRRVTFVVGIDETRRARLYASGQVGLFPGAPRGESRAVEIGRVQACGTPVVVVGEDAADSLLEARTGRTARPADRASLALAVERCLDPRARTEMVRAARAYAETACCARRMATAVLDAYEDVLRMPRGKGTRGKAAEGGWTGLRTP